MLIFPVQLRLGSDLKLGKEKSKRKFYRIFFATDVHASEIVFRKFIGAAKFYEADTLVMGGDITGKTLVPVVEGSSGKYDSHCRNIKLRSQGELPASLLLSSFLHEIWQYLGLVVLDGFNQVFSIFVGLPEHEELHSCINELFDSFNCVVRSS